jgi:hypothetical protein
MIRNAAAQDIVAFLGILEPKNWPECLTLLVNQLDDQDTVHQEVCHHSPVLIRCFFGCGLSSVVALPLRSCRVGIFPPEHEREISRSRVPRGIGRHIPCLVYTPTLKELSIKDLRRIFFNLEKFPDRETNSLRSELLLVSFYGLSAIGQRLSLAIIRTG